MKRNDFNLCSCFHCFLLPLFPPSTDEKRACLKKFVKEDLTQFFKLNQLLNRVQACILYFTFIVPHRKISWLELQKKYKNVESNGEEAKGNYKAGNVNLRPPQLQFFKDELTITATDTIIIKGIESNNTLRKFTKDEY